MSDPAPGDASGTWLKHGRDAGRGADERSKVVRLLSEIRDRVLAGAQLRPGQAVLDLGAGTGLLASEALRLVAPNGTVFALDQSQSALAEISVPPDYDPSRLRCIVGDAHRIQLASGTVDAVLTRSVLIYLDDLSAALAEVARVLRPGGRLSVFEPINGGRRHDANLVGMTDDELVAIQALRAQASTVVPAMMAFDENKFITAANAAGLTVVARETEAVTEQLGDHSAVDAYLHRPPHPGAPTPVELLTRGLGEAVANRYAAAWHNALDQAAPGVGITFSTPVLYLTAVRS
jgi:ubiquinone/menaquinone biosynthesis C-methylase UbiE